MFRLAIVVIALLPLAAAVSSQDMFQDRVEALQAAKHAYEIAESSKMADDARVAQVTLDYGMALLRNFDAEESRRVLKLALERYEDAYGKDSPRQIDVLLQLAQADFVLRRSRSSKKHLKKARTLAAELFDNASVEYADYMYRIGRVSNALTYTDEALEDIAAAHRIYVSNFEPMSIRLGESSHLLGKMYLDEGRMDEAEPLLQAALQIFDSTNPALFDRHIQVLADWGGGLESRGLRDEATVFYVEAGRLQEPLATDLKPLFRVAPQYPEDALRSGISGFVEWQFTVDERGFVVDPEIIRYQGARSFEKASLDALMRFRYPPRFVDGQPVATPGVTSTISFVLEN
jgi:TonB family protein